MTEYVSLGELRSAMARFHRHATQMASAKDYSSVVDSLDSLAIVARFLNEVRIYVYARCHQASALVALEQIGDAIEIYQYLFEKLDAAKLRALHQIDVHQLVAGIQSIVDAAYPNPDVSLDLCEAILTSAVAWLAGTPWSVLSCRLRRERGLIWMDQGHTAKSLVELEEALALRRSASSTSDLLPLDIYLEPIACALCDLRRWEKARPFCTQLAEDKCASISSRIWAWTQLAHVYLNTDHLDAELVQTIERGLDWLEQVNQAAHGHGLRLARGQVWMEQGRIDKALAELREALSLRRSVQVNEDTLPLSIYLEPLARLLCRLERWDEAEPLCAELADDGDATMPVRVWAWTQLAHVYLNTEHPDEKVESVAERGLDWLECVDRLVHGHGLRLMRGKLWLRQQRTDEALVELREALALRRQVPAGSEIPSLDMYLETLARPLCNLERWNEAKPLCSELTETEGAPVMTRAWAWSQLARIYIETERPGQAERAAKRALALGEVSKDTQRRAMLVLACIWLNRGYAALQASPQEISLQERHQRVSEAHRNALRWLDEASIVTGVEGDKCFVNLQERANELIEKLFAKHQKEPDPGVVPGEVWRVFISSTIKDLKRYREAVFERLQSVSRIQIVNLSMETMGSQPVSPQEASLEQVAACDLFIGIYARRYGYIPPENDRSITQQEFEEAYKSGKRCLCYFADASAEFPSESIETDKDKRAKLWAFQDSINENLVSVDRFRTPNHLASLVASDWAEILSGEPRGFDPKYFNRQCFETAERRAAWLWQGLRGKTGHIVQSSLHQTWRNFAEQVPWHERMRKCVNRCKLCLEKLTKNITKKQGKEVPRWLKNLHQQCCGLDYKMNYVRITRAITEVSGYKVRRRLSRLKRELRYDPELSDLCEEAETRLVHMERQVQYPLYQRCFLLRGGPGSGKTQFIFQLLDGALESGVYIPILIRLPKGKVQDLEEVVLDELRQASRYGWRSLEEANRFLEKHSLRIVLIIDDLRRWGSEIPSFIGQLSDLISEGSEWHSLYYLVTARDRSLDLFRVSGGREFWLENGFRSEDQRWKKALEPVPPLDDERRTVWVEQMEQEGDTGETVPHVGGWISVDDLNRKEETGLNIVNDQTERTPDLSSMEASSRRHLCTPSIAWIVVDLVNAGAIHPSALLSIRFISFIEKFWELKRGQIEAETPRGKDVFLWMDQAVAWIADYCVHHNVDEEVRAKLLDSVVEQAQGQSTELTSPERAERIITKLELENLLEWIITRQDGVPIKLEKLRFDIFWQYHLARRLYYRPAFQKQDLKKGKELLRRYFPVNHKPSLGLQGGMLEFLFLILDNEGLQEAFVEEIIEFTLQSLPTWRQTIWYAGPKASTQFQKSVMTWTIDHGNEVAGERDLFALLYFLRDLVDTDTTLTSRFRLLSPHYGAFAEHSLDALFWDLSQRWFRQPFEVDDIRRSLIYLHGTEKMGLGKDMAEVSFSALVRHLKSEDKAPRQMLDWMTELIAEARGQIDWPKSPKPWRRERYLEWLLCDFCRWLVGSERLKAYYLLKDQGWFETTEWWPFSIAMEREANIALGYACRNLFYESEREEYVHVISSLMRSENKNRVRQAFYMAWHADWYDRLFKGVRKQMKIEPLLEDRRDDPQYEDFFADA